ncbi:hypothetical protein [Rufibacter roseus]|uniref:Uncharacterized protein n=1 Tax=Rufibacter roseus TaxID=1567108 RepID=A0ABW2DKZ0_9BACT|nr:hypothetical protein [Rufibacter roseus]
MINFKISTFVGLICLVQLLVVFGFGLYNENGDIIAASLYLLVFFLPAVLINFIMGFSLILINFKSRLDRLVFLLLFVTVAFLVGNELLETTGYVLYRWVIIASSLLCGLYFYRGLKKNQAAAQ